MMPRDDAISTAGSAERFIKVRRRLPLRPFWIILLILIAGVAATASWYFTGPLELTAARAIRGPAANVVYATGFVEPRRPVNVSSRVTAPVAHVLADEGNRVVRGQVLVQLESTDLEQALAELSALRLNAEQDEQRALALYRQGFLARAARDKAVASATSARAAEAAARARANQYLIRSGITGVILRREVEPGDLATPSKTLFQLGDPGDLRVTVTVDERDIPLVRNGARAMMSTDAYPGRVVRGTVYEITPGGDPEQRAFRVRIRPDGMSDLPIGLTLEVNILVYQKDRALLVPGGSVRQSAIWVAEDGRAKKLAVKTGIRGEKSVEITSGLKDGACVIKEPPPDLKDGKHISIKGC